MRSVQDTRIGKHFLKASVGFGGSCFKKDILNLVYISRSLHLDPVADYWESVLKINDWQQHRFVKNMLKNMFNTVADKKIAVLGFAFKANTGDIRESPAITVCKDLLEEQAQLTISDPQALKNAKEYFKPYNDSIVYEKNPYKACEQSHAIIVLTEWQEYAQLDFDKLYQSVRKPAYIFDGRNILPHKELHKIGFHVFRIGAEPLKH